MAVAVQFSNRNYDGAVTKIHELLIDCDNFDVDIIDTVRSDILSIPLVKEMFQYYVSHYGMTSKTANTLFYIASICDYSEGIRFLLVNDSIKVNFANKIGITAIYYACQGGNVASLKRLLEVPDIDVNKSVVDPLFTFDEEWHHLICSPLAVAIYYGHHECVKMLLAHPSIKVDQNNDECNVTPLMVACIKGDPTSTAMLLACKDLNLTEETIDLYPDSDIEEGKTALGYAIEQTFYNPIHTSDHYRCAELLIADERANHEFLNQGSSFDTALGLAGYSINKESDIFKLLLKDDRTDINQGSPNDDTTALARAIDNFNPEIFLAIAGDLHCNLNRVGKTMGETPLILAVAQGNREVVNVLLDDTIYGRCSQLPGWKQTFVGFLLCNSAMKNPLSYMTIVSIFSFLSPKIDVNVQLKTDFDLHTYFSENMRYGATALWLAAHHNEVGILERLLLEDTIDATLVDITGLTPLEIAKNKGNTACVDALTAYFQRNRLIIT